MCGRNVIDAQSNFLIQSSPMEIQLANSNEILLTETFSLPPT